MEEFKIDKRIKTKESRKAESTKKYKFKYWLKTKDNKELSGEIDATKKSSAIKILKIRNPGSKDITVKNVKMAYPMMHLGY